MAGYVTGALGGRFAARRGLQRGAVCSAARFAARRGLQRGAVCSAARFAARRGLQRGAVCSAARFAARRGWHAAKFIFTLFVVQGLVLGRLQAQVSYKSIAPPGITSSTYCTGVSGNNVVGYYADSGGSLLYTGFLYNGSTYMTLSPPGSTSSYCYGVSGDTVVGGYQDSSSVFHGFLYNGSTYKTIDPPGTIYSYCSAISGTNVAGAYQDSSSVSHGFFYNGSTYKTIDPPGTNYTICNGVSGSNVVGEYRDSSDVLHGFLYDGSAYKTIDPPGSTATYCSAVSGNSVVGYYKDSSGVSHGFLYDGSAYTVIDPPGDTYTYCSAISGSNVVGYSEDDHAVSHGFLYNGTTYTSIEPPGITTDTYCGGVSGNSVVGYYIDSNNDYHAFSATVGSGTGSAPTITSFTPTSGPPGTAVTITGTGFTAPIGVSFNGTAATTATAAASTKITTKVPTGATTGTIKVTASGGMVTSTGTFTVTAGAPVVAKVVLSDLTQTYTGSPAPVTVTTTPANLSTSVTYSSTTYPASTTAPTDAGSYTATATITESGYTGSAKGTLVISKGTATVTLSDLTATYDGNPHGATVVTSPSGLAVTTTYAGKTTLPVNAGSYAVVATVTDPNHTGSGKGTLVIDKATATITLGGLSATYTGKAVAATATTSPVGLAVTFAYTQNGKAASPVLPGTYNVTATVNTANAAGTKTGTLTISLAAPTVYLGAADAEVSYWVNPGGVATTVLFEYSTSPSGTFIQTASQNLGKGTVPVDVYALFSGLEPGTLYYYRIVTTTGTGSPVDGPLESFTTLGFETTRVAQTGDFAVGSSGPTFASFGNGAVDGNDDVAFAATLTSGVAGVTASDDAGIWIDNNGTRNLIAQTGASAPGVSGAVFATLTDPVYDNNADVAFGATLKAGTGSVTAADAKGVWATNGSSTPALIAREGSVAPGTGSAKFATFTAVGLTDSGGAIVAGTVSGGTPAVTAADNAGVWEGKTSGILALMLRNGEMVSTSSGTKTIASFKFLPVEAYVNGQTRGFGPTTGHLAANATYSDKTTGLVKVTTAASPTAVATSGDAAAGTTGATFAVFSSPAINDTNRVAFAATVKGGDTTTKNAGGIWAENSGGTRQLVARLGSMAPGTGTSATFLTLSDPVFNANEAVAFRGTLSVGTGLATAATASGIWCNSTGVLALVAQQGGQAPGCPAGVTFSSFNELALDDVDGATHKGGVMFLATLSGTGVTAANNTAIFAQDSAGAVQLIVRTGDVLNGKTITALAFLPAETTTNALVGGQGRSFSSSTGDLVYNATFSDKSQAIFNVVFP